MNSSPTVTLTSGATDGTTAQGKTFVVAPSAPHSDQTQVYTITVLDVTITTP